MEETALLPTMVNVLLPTTAVNALLPVANALLPTTAVNALPPVANAPLPTTVVNAPPPAVNALPPAVNAPLPTMVVNALLPATVVNALPEFSVALPLGALLRETHPEAEMRDSFVSHLILELHSATRLVLIMTCPGVPWFLLSPVPLIAQ